MRCASGERRVIAPWQMAEKGVVSPDWPRADLNLACYEFLIGLIFLADPPRDATDWSARRAADPKRLRAKLEAYAGAFNLFGGGPRFLQDLEPLDGDQKAPDILFLDSAGAQTIRNNADVMVHRFRYDRLPFAEAAMGIYTLQSQAASGGAGNRTSMRGGGPLITLVNPERELWDLVWANVPCGEPSDIEALPWMRPTETSEKGQVRLPPKGRDFDVEAFFGMPRRLRLVSNGAHVIGVIQKNYGTKYSGWKHPLSPYYRLKVDEEWRPKHPTVGRFGYRNWLGVIVRRTDNDLTELALSLRVWLAERDGGGSVIVGGWAVDNAKPLDFVFSQQRLSAYSDKEIGDLSALVSAAGGVADALISSLRPVLGAGEARAVQKSEFYLETEARFREFFALILDRSRSQITPYPVNIEESWLKVLRTQALKQFDAVGMPGVSLRRVGRVEEVVTARRFLSMALNGYSKPGKAIFSALGLSEPVTKKSKKASKA